MSILEPSGPLPGGVAFTFGFRRHYDIAISSPSASCRMTSYRHEFTPMKNVAKDVNPSARRLAGAV